MHRVEAEKPITHPAITERLFISYQSEAFQSKPVQHRRGSALYGSLKEKIKRAY